MPVSPPTFRANIKHLRPVPGDALGDLAGHAREPDLTLCALVVAGEDAVGVAEVLVGNAVGRRRGGRALPYRALGICVEDENKNVSKFFDSVCFHLG